MAFPPGALLDGEPVQLRPAVRAQAPGVIGTGPPRPQLTTRSLGRRVLSGSGFGRGSTPPANSYKLYDLSAREGSVWEEGGVKHERDPLTGEVRPVTAESPVTGTEPTPDRPIAEGPDAAGGLRRPRRSRPLRAVALAVGVVLIGLVLVLGSRLGKDPALVRSPLLGKTAPQFSLPRFDQPGRVFSSQLSGRIYVVNFWASWCVPCWRETPALDAFYRQWQPRGVELVGILYNDTVEAALAFRRELEGAWPLADDPGGRTAIDYGVFGIPETFVIDERGIVMAKLTGAIGPGVLEDTLARLGAGSEPVFSENDQYQRGR